MSDQDSPPASVAPTSLAPVRVTVSRSHLRRSISANVLSGDRVQADSRPAATITPISSPAPSPRAVEQTRTRPRTRHYVAQEEAFLAASRNVASSSRTVLGDQTLEQSTPVAEPTALANEESDFHLPVASTPTEASAPPSVTQQTPLTPSLYGVPQPQEFASSAPVAASLSLDIPASTTVSSLPQAVVATGELARVSRYNRSQQR
jgi:hypothetical protein